MYWKFKINPRVELITDPYKKMCNKLMLIFLNHEVSYTLKNLGTSPEMKELNHL